VDVRTQDGDVPSSRLDDRNEREHAVPVVLLIDPDPYLAFLIRLHVPEATVVEATSTDEASRTEDAALIVAPLDRAASLLEAVPFGGRLPTILAVVDRSRAGRSIVPSAVGGVIARPFVPGEVATAVREALGLPVHGGSGLSRPLLNRVRTLLGPARLAGIAAGAVMEVAGGSVGSGRAAILAIAFVYVAMRWLFRRDSMVLDSSDVAIALALVVSTDGISSPYAPYALVVCLAVGFMRGPRWGAGAGAAIVAGTFGILFEDLQSVSATSLAAWAALFPLLGVLGGFMARVWRDPSVEGLNLLVEANRVLSSLYRIARTLPGGLEIGGVADATMQEIADVLGARGGAMLLAEAGSYVVAGSFGLEDPGTVVVDDSAGGLVTGQVTAVSTADLHPITARALGDEPTWLSAPMRSDTGTIGLLIAAVPDAGRAAAVLQRLADESSLAVENARLFSRVREISIDEERRRLARELHDGVAQSLTHLRLELDFLARQQEKDSEEREEVERLVRVVERTAGDVRSMILGLRSSVADEGIVGALGSYLGDLRRLGGPRIEFITHGDYRTSPDVEGEVFRVAQEAVSNALRHATPTAITVRLTLGSAQVRLLVEDDGVGIAAGGERASTSEILGGVGMQAMRERADKIGARFRVEPRRPHGTRVLLEYDVGGEP